MTQCCWQRATGKCPLVMACASGGPACLHCIDTALWMHRDEAGSPVAALSLAEQAVQAHGGLQLLALLWLDAWRQAGLSGECLLCTACVYLVCSSD